MKSIALLLVVAACSGKKGHKDDAAVVVQVSRDAAQVDAAAVDPDTTVTWYRVEAAVNDKGHVPFVIGVDKEKPVGWIISGATERLPLVVERRDPMLVLRIPVRGVELRLAPDGGASGKLTGQWLVKYYFKRDFDITAEPIAAPRPELVFPGGEAPAVDLSGTWRIDIKEFGVGRAVLAQQADGTLDGTFIPPEVGDIRYLRGRVTGNTGRMSVFDGIHGFLVELTAGKDGKSLTGHWLISGIGNFTFTATRAEAPPTHIGVSAVMAAGKTKLASLPGLEKAPYLGNPVIVDYFGSWCPVCMDLTPELVRVHDAHAKDGLQIYSIALEPDEDHADAQKRLDEFRAAFKVSWPFAEVKFGDDFAAQLPPEVKKATGFPLTIFLRRDHTVAGIHTGFVSKAAGAEHDAVVKELDRLTDEIIRR